MTEADNKRVVDAYKHVFATPEGKIVLKDLMSAHCMYSPTFTDTTENMLLREGGRNVLLRILAIIDKKPTME